MIMSARKNNGLPEGSGIEGHGHHLHSDAAHKKSLERFATPEEQIEHLIKTVRHMSDKFKDKDKEHKRQMEEIKHERDVAIRRLSKAREKMKRLNNWMQFG